jgi:hypothetical protein
MTNWPSQAQMNEFYGRPDADGDLQPDAKWEAENLTTIVPPYRMVAAWAPGQTISRIRVHKRCAGSLSAALERIFGHYRTQEAIEKARMHLYGGCYNFRLMRGGTKLSIHSWGAAIDLDPERNGLGVPWRPGAGMMPEAVVEAFRAEGWVWGGPWSRPDAMHFQAARV